MHATPTPDDLRAIPERAPLALLDVALAVARAALIAETPELGALDDTFGGRGPPLYAELAALLVTHADIMRDLIERYLAAVDDLRRASRDDDLPF